MLINTKLKSDYYHLLSDLLGTMNKLSSCSVYTYVVFFFQYYLLRNILNDLSVYDLVTDVSKHNSNKTAKCRKEKKREIPKKKNDFKLTFEQFSQGNLRITPCCKD